MPSAAETLDAPAAPSATDFLDAPVAAPKAAAFLDAPAATPAVEKNNINPADFDTKLSATDEEKFQQWKVKVAPNDSGNDYDFRGAFKAGLAPSGNGHWSDQFKKPNHPTFSNESIYAGQRPDLAGSWDGEKFIPPAAAPAVALGAPKAGDFLDSETPSVHGDLRRQWDKAGPLERLGMLWKNFSYDKSVEQAFTPAAGSPQIPTIAPTGGTGAQIGKTLLNTVDGAINGLAAPGVGSLLSSPATGLYAAPYFIKKALEAAPEAWKSYFDPNATAADRTQKTAAALMDALGGLGLAKTGLSGAAGIAGAIAGKVAPGATAALSNRIASSPVRDAMTFTRDAADNNAERTANVTSNDIRGPLRREFGDNAGKAENALSFMVEGLNDPTNLDVMRQKVDASTAASPKWKQAALDAIDFAKANFNKLKPVAENYGDITLKQWQAENSAGQTTPYRPGYVMHAQDIADPAGFESISGSSGGDGATGFRMMREHATLADSIAAGVDPKSINSVDLLRSRLASGQKLVNRNAWADSLQDLKDPTNKLPVATNAVVETRPDGTTYNTVPDGYQPEQFGNRTLAVQKGYGGIFKAITDPSALSQEEFIPMLQKANALGKSVNLLFDTFHLGRIAMWDSAIKASGLKTFKAPFPSYGQGLTLMDHSPEEITKMAQAGEVPQAWLPKVLQNKATLDLLEKNGMNSGRVADAMHQEWVRNIPGIGQFNKFVFEKFQRGAMSEIGLLEHERQRAMYPDLTDDQVARKVATDVNTRFGNFGRQGIFKSRTFQDLARMVVLAPQWNEGLIKSELGAVKQGAAAIKDAVVNRRLASGMLARGTATMVLGQLAANQLINHFTRGKPTWENQEEGPSAKLSAWIPDKIGGSAGFFLNPTALAAETSHLFEKNLEKDPSWQKAMASYGRSRLSALGRPIATFITKTDGLGRPIKSGDLAKEVSKSAIPVPIASDAAASAFKQLKSGQPSESFAGQYQKQLMATVGLKTDNAPSPEQRIYSLARDFNRGKGVPEQPQFAASDFEPLTSALRIGNKNDARDAIEELLQHKTPAEIEKHYTTQAHSPFTGKHTREAQFLATLNPEQAATYQLARAAKVKLRQDAVSTMLGYLAQNKASGKN